MRVPLCILPAGLLLLVQGAAAQVQPHRAEYILRLGSAINAPRVGAATQDLTLDCDGWHLKRDVKGEVPLSATWKLSVVSQLDSEEHRSGDDLRFRALQVQNGTEREVRGTVQRANGELRADITSPDGPAQLRLPPLTMMPVASINYIIDKLRAGATSFPALTFDAQGTNDASRVDVTLIEDSAIRRRPPAEKPVDVRGRSWPVSMSFTKGVNEQQKPLFAFSARLFESGVLDHVTVNADVATVSADLQTLEMRPSPRCR
jgi:envelope integrity protein B